MYLLSVFFSLYSVVLIWLFGRNLGYKGSWILSVLGIFLSLLTACFIFYEVGICNSVCNIILGQWINVGIFQIQWGFLFDSITSVMLIVVTSISLLVHIYSFEYMAQDPYKSRFFSYLSLFTFFMLILVTADNFVQMFLGWEGVGLASFLLISFWYTRLSASQAALKAMLMNRIGDGALIIAMGLIFLVFKTLDYSIIFSLVEYFSYSTYILEDRCYLFMHPFGVNLRLYLLPIICLLILIGVAGKSSQLGLHTWLPDAMEGPTPVSALIHAATMVTAGVFLVIRCSPIFSLNNNVLTWLVILGGLTAFFGATAGVVQNDLKRVIAYSTCSQLGYMIFACGLMGYDVALFHLFNHAFFKALLFLGAGSIIHAMLDEQDFRSYGSLVKFLPYTYVLMLIGSLALIGFPFLTGFYSKDRILELAYSQYSVNGFWIYGVGTLAAGFTAFYSARLLYLTFYSRYNGLRTTLPFIHESKWPMSAVLFPLGLASIFIGFLCSDFFIGLGTNFWQQSIVLNNYSNMNGFFLFEFIPVLLKMFPVIFSLVIGCLALFFYTLGSKYFYDISLNAKFIIFYKFLMGRWYFDFIYSVLIMQQLLKFSYNITLKVLDRGWSEWFGSQGLSSFFFKLSFLQTSLQTGYVYHYVIFMMLGIFVSFILIFSFPLVLGFIAFINAIALLIISMYEKEIIIKSKIKYNKV